MMYLDAWGRVVDDRDVARDVGRERSMRCDCCGSHMKMWDEDVDCSDHGDFECGAVWICVYCGAVVEV